jgi:DNA invertase Pin-like site-specific DNA recombinase
MTIIGYARVSTTDQDLSLQEAAPRAWGCDTIRAEKRSGTSTAGPGGIAPVLDFLCKGDVLMVTRIDRLAPQRRRLGRHHAHGEGPRRIPQGYRTT